MGGGGKGLAELTVTLGRHCERSEAIQSGLRGPLDCFVASLLAMTVASYKTYFERSVFRAMSASWVST